MLKIFLKKIEFPVILGQWQIGISYALGLSFLCFFSNLKIVCFQSLLYLQRNIGLYLTLSLSRRILPEAVIRMHAMLIASLLSVKDGYFAICHATFQFLKSLPLLPRLDSLISLIQIAMRLFSSCVFNSAMDFCFVLLLFFFIVVIQSI